MTARTNSQSLSVGDQNPSRQAWCQFTADRPGIYRFAVGRDSPNFTGGSPFVGEIDYQLQITSVGNVGLDGLFVNGTVLATLGSAGPLGKATMRN